MSSKWKLRLISHAVMEMGRIGLGEGRKSIIPPPLGDNELKELANAEAGKSKIGKGGAKGRLEYQRDGSGEVYGAARTR